MSKTVLYMAISSDGFIADINDATPWSDEEWEAFQHFVMTCDIVLLGRRTYEIISKNDEFVEGPEYIVATNDKSYDAGNFKTINIKSKKDMPQAGKVGIIGGGELNGQLAKMGLIDEMILDIEPIKLGNGTRLFGKHDVPLKLELVGSKLIGDNTMQRHYKILN